MQLLCNKYSASKGMYRDRNKGGVLRTLLNIYDVAFLQKLLTPLKAL